MAEDTATSTPTTNMLANSGAFDAAPAPPPDQQMMPAAAELTPPSAPAAAPVLSGLQPAAPPPAAGQPSVWKNIVMGAIYGLAGSGGAKSFGAGAGGGAANVLAQEQLQKENAARDKQQQSDIQFKSVQAAHMAAETTVLNRQLSTMDEDHQQEVFKNGLSAAKTLQSLGFTPEFSTNDENDASGASATQALKDSAAKNGGVPPYLSVPVGPHQWLHFNMQAAAQNGTAMKIINDTNQRFGKPTITSAVPPKPGSPEEQAMIKTADDNWDLLHTPTSDPGKLQSMQNSLALVQGLPDDTYLKSDTTNLLKKNIAASQPLVDKAAKDTGTRKGSAAAAATAADPGAAALQQSEIAKNRAEAAKTQADMGGGEWKPKVTADEKKKAELAENIAENATAVNAILARRPDLVGAVAGRFTNAQQMIGNNDKDISAVGNRVHNIAMANSGVHGFRSQEGVEETEKNILNSFKNGPDAVKGALSSNVDSVQTFIDNARPEGYQTHSKQGGAGAYYHNKLAAPQPIYASAPGKPRMMSTDGGKTWQTAPAQ